MPSDTPLDQQLQALGRQLDAVAPPVAPHELAEATPTAEVAHLQPVAASDPDRTLVIPLAPLPVGPTAPCRGRRLLGAAAAALVLVGGATALALAGGDDEVRTEDPVELQPAGDPGQAPATDEPSVDLGGFGEVAEAFATCMEGSGFAVEVPEGDGVGSFQDLAAMIADPAFFDAMSECTASSGLEGLDLGAELEELDIEGTLEEQLGETLDESITSMLDDVIAEVEGIDMTEVTAQLDAWLAEVEAELQQGDLRERVAEAGARADEVVACMEERGYSSLTFPEGGFGGTDGDIEQLLADLRECTEQG